MENTVAPQTSSPVDSNVSYDTHVSPHEALSTRLAWAGINLVQAVFFAAWTAFCVSCACVALLFWRKLPLIMARHMWAPPLLFFAGARVTTKGLQNVPRDRPVIFVCNHQSMFDIALVFKVLPVNLHFVLKKELAFAPFIGLFAWATGMIFVDRKNRKAAIASVRRVGKMVSEGRSIIAFPEGTRSREQKILPFKKGVFVSALSAHVPVVPVALEGANRVLPSQGFRVRPSPVRVNVGQAIFTEGMTEQDRDVLLERAQNAVRELYEEIRLPPAR